MSPTVLHVEDDPSIRLLVRLLFQRVLPQVTVQSVADGQQAVDYLAGTGAYADRCSFPLPQLVLLDLDMPVLSGFEVLSWARAQEAFKNLPIVALSSFAVPEDYWSAKRLGATNCLRKTPQFADVLDYVRSFFAALKQVPESGGALVGSPAGSGPQEQFSLEVREAAACGAVPH